MIWCWILIVPLGDLIFKWIEIDIKATSMHRFDINLIIHHLIAMQLWNCPLAFFPIKLHNSKLSQNQRLKSTSRTAGFNVVTTLNLKITVLIQMHWNHHRCLKYFEKVSQTQGKLLGQKRINTHYSLHLIFPRAVNNTSSNMVSPCW